VPLNTIDVAKRAVEIASDKLATDVVLLDTRQVCSFADYFVICSGETERHLAALREAIDEAFSKENMPARRHEGTPASGWVLIDFGNVIVHLFAPLERQYYGFDKLWGGAQLLVKMQ
jgi:ribosome-associated protein